MSTTAIKFGMHDIWHIGTYRLRQKVKRFIFFRATYRCIVQRQTCSYLPSCTASLPLGRYQIILLADRGTCASSKCPRLLPVSGRESNLRSVARKSNAQTIKPSRNATCSFHLTRVSILQLVSITDRFVRGYSHYSVEPL